jgi:hypothetical protein
MLKANLAEKLQISLSTIKLINKKNNKNYDDNDLISLVYNQYINDKEFNIINSSNSDSIYNDNFNNNNDNNIKNNYMCMKLIKFSNLKCSINIDFTFNYMKEIKKIDFQNSAPNYREASDGINIFAYCENKKCLINKEMFIIKLGKFIIKI